MTRQPTAEAVASVGNEITYVGADEGDWCRPAGAAVWPLTALPLPGLTECTTLTSIALAKTRDGKLDLSWSHFPWLSFRKFGSHGGEQSRPVGENHLWGRLDFETHWPEVASRIAQILNAVTESTPGGFATR